MNLLIHGLLLTISSSLYAALSKIIIVVYYSYNDCEFIRDLYKDYNVISVDRLNLLSANTNNQQRFKEIIITNYC